MGVLKQIAAVTLLTLQASHSVSAALWSSWSAWRQSLLWSYRFLSMSTAFLESVNKTGRADRAIVTNSGAITESLSSLPRETIRVIIDAPGVKRGGDGKAVVSADIFAYQPVTKKSDGLNIRPESMFYLLEAAQMPSAPIPCMVA